MKKIIIGIITIILILISITSCCKEKIIYVPSPEDCGVRDVDLSWDVGRVTLSVAYIGISGYSVKYVGEGDMLSYEELDRDLLPNRIMVCLSDTEPHEILTEKYTMGKIYEKEFNGRKIQFACTSNIEYNHGVIIYVASDSTLNIEEVPYKKFDSKNLEEVVGAVDVNIKFGK